MNQDNYLEELHPTGSTGQNTYPLESKNEGLSHITNGDMVNESKTTTLPRRRN